MIGAAHISKSLGRIDESTVERLQNLINKLGMVSRAENCDIEHMFKALFRDKKTINGKINWVLMDSIGTVSIVNDVPEISIPAIVPLSTVKLSCNPLTVISALPILL